MPIYEYRCAACGHELEALQRLADAPLQDCPTCGRNQLRKLVSAAGFRLKGSGWYATDFKHPSKPAAKSNGAGDKSEGDKSAGDKSASDKSEPAAPAAESTSTKPAATETKAETKPASGSDTCH